jgi:hypothetical protein
MTRLALRTTPHIFRFCGRWYCCFAAGGGERNILAVRFVWRMNEGISK